MGIKRRSGNSAGVRLADLLVTCELCGRELPVVIPGIGHEHVWCSACQAQHIVQWRLGDLAVEHVPGTGKVPWRFRRWFGNLLNTLHQWLAGDVR